MRSPAVAACCGNRRRHLEWRAGEMTNLFLRSRRDLLAKTPLLAGAVMLADDIALAQSGQDVTRQFDRLDNIGDDPAAGAGDRREVE